MISDGEGPPKSYLPERTKGDGQVILLLCNYSYPIRCNSYSFCHKKSLIVRTFRFYHFFQEKSPQFLSNKRGGNGSYHSDNEGGKLRRQHPHQQYRSRGGYHSDTGGMKRGGYSSGGDSYKPSSE